MGQVGSAFGNSNTFAPDPSDLSGSEMGARFLGKGAQGLMQGFSNMQQQNAQMRQGGGGGGAASVAPVQPSNIQFGSTNFTPGAGTGAPGSVPKSKNPYFYGYGEGQ